MTTTSPTTAAARSSAAVQFGALIGIEFLTVMDASVVNIALPVIKHELGYSTSGIAWVVNCYLIGFAGLLLASGRLSDVLGRRRLFLAGTLLFTLASSLCGLADQPWQLLAARGLQGIGAALVVPAALALITDIYAEGPQRIRALGVFAGTGAVAAPFGLALGGALTALDWHLIFWVNVPLGLVVAVVAASTLPRSRHASVPVDLLGAAAATGTLSLLALAAMSLTAAGPIAPVTLGAAAGAVMCALGLTLRQRYATDPLVPRALLGRRSVVVGNGLFVLVGTVMLGTFFFVTLYLQEIRGLSPLRATLAYLPIPFAMLAGTQLASRLIVRLGSRNTLGLGLLTQAVMLVAWTLVSDSSGSLALTLVAPTVGWAIGMGVSLVCSFVICTSGLPATLAGAASGLASTAHQGGGAVGLALVAALAAVATDGVAATPEAMRVAHLSGQHWGTWALAGTSALAALMTRMLPRIGCAGP